MAGGMGLSEEYYLYIISFTIKKLSELEKKKMNITVKE